MYIYIIRIYIYIYIYIYNTYIDICSKLNMNCITTLPIVTRVIGNTK